MPDWLASVEALSQYARPGAEAREQGVLSGIRTVALWCLLPLLLAALVLPFVLRQNAWYEWANYYWLLVKQTDTIRHLGHPSYFLSYPGGLFYPQYVFYGATLWSATGYLALVTGSVWGAFLAVTLLAFAMAAGGTWWLARQLGVDRRLALLAAALVPTSPYYLSILYGRGGWPEFVAVSALPVVIASAVAVVRRPRIDVLPPVLLFLSTALIAGSHNITLFWGGLFAIAALLALGLIAWRAGAPPAPRRVALLAAIAAAGVLVNAWYLLPDTAYGHDTLSYLDAGRWTDVLIAFDRPGNLFYPWNHSPMAGSNLYAQLPLYPLLWGLVAGVVLVWRRGGPMRSGWLASLVLLAATLVLVMVHAIWRGLPLFFRAIQFPLRLDAYSILAVAGIVIAALLATQRSARSRVWIVALVGALTLQAGLALAQTWGDKANPHLGHRTVIQTKLPISYQSYQQQMFRFTTGTPVTPDATAETVDRTRDDGAALLRGQATRAGERFATAVVYSPFVKASGDARIVGRDQAGMAVVQADRSGPWTAEVRSKHPSAMKAGIAISIVTFGLALVGLALLVWRRFSRA